MIVIFDKNVESELNFNYFIPFPILIKPNFVSLPYLDDHSNHITHLLEDNSILTGGWNNILMHFAKKTIIPHNLSLVFDSWIIYNLSLLELHTIREAY